MIDHAMAVSLIHAAQGFAFAGIGGGMAWGLAPLHRRRWLERCGLCLFVLFEGTAVACVAGSVWLALR
jgi:hypothetical protein